MPHMQRVAIMRKVANTGIILDLPVEIIHEPSMASLIDHADEKKEGARVHPVVQHLINAAFYPLDI